MHHVEREMEMGRRQTYALEGRDSSTRRSKGVRVRVAVDMVDEPKL
jgi:hypothetical protein